MIKSIFHGATGSSDLIEPSWPELPCGWEVFGVTGPTGITYAQDIGTTAGGYSPLHVGTSFMLGWTGDQPPAGTTYSVSGIHGRAARRVHQPAVVQRVHLQP